MSTNYLTIPTAVLDRTQTLQALQNTEWMKEPFPSPYKVKSQWLCDELNRFEKDSGFVYNLSAMRRIEKENNLPESPENSSALSLLIYNAQAFREVDKLKAAGFEMLTDELIDQAAKEKKLLEVVSIGSLCGGSLCRPGADPSGKPFAFIKGKRQRGYYPSVERGARLVARDYKPEEPAQTFIGGVAVQVVGVPATPEPSA